MANFVLVHGMWHGGWCWKKVAPLLRAAGHEVYTPTLTGLGERAHLWRADIDLATHLQDVINVFEFEDVTDAILVGHSLGGWMAPVIADKIPHRIAHLVNLDGPLPENGNALKDQIGDYWDFFLKSAIVAGDEGRFQPITDWTFGVSGPDLAWMQSKLTPNPIKPLTSPINLTNEAANAIPRTYIACAGDATTDEELATEAEKYAAIGWGYRFLRTEHDAMITQPDELSNILLDLV